MARKTYELPRRPARRSYLTTSPSWRLPGSTVPTPTTPQTRATRPSGTARTVDHATGTGRPDWLRWRQAAFMALARTEGLTGSEARARADLLFRRWRDRTGAAPPTGIVTTGKPFTAKTNARTEDYR